MKFEKRLIILNGANNAKGTLNLEHNAYGTFANLSIYNLTDLRRGEYVVGIKTTNYTFKREMGTLGKIAMRFQIEDIDISAVHVIVFDTTNESVLLYGTNDAKKLWEGNMMDGLRSKDIEQQTQIKNENGKKAFSEYSSREKEIGNYFFDITPSEKGEEFIMLKEPEDEYNEQQPNDVFKQLNSFDLEYADSALAQVNYYPSNMEFNYSTLNDVDKKQFRNPIDKELDGGAGTGKNKAGFDIASNYSTYINDTANTKNNTSLDSDSSDDLYIPTNSFGVKLGFGGDSVNNKNSINSNKNQIKNDMASSDKVSLKNANNLNNNKKQDKLKTEPNPENDSIELGGKIQSNLNLGGDFLKDRGIDFINDDDSEKKTLKPKSKNQQNLNFFNDEILTQSKGSNDSFGEAAATIPPPSSFSTQSAINSGAMESIFYEQVKPQIDDLFKNNSRFELLEKLMPDTKWVKVDYDESGKYYVVGLIGDNPDFVCYGVPAKFSPTPPQELSGFCQWLPIEEKDPKGEGFWLMFQDAKSGESIKSDMT